MTRRPKRSGLFLGFWTTLSGQRLERATRADLAEAYRLRAKHGDLCGGKRGCGCGPDELCVEHSAEMATA